MKLTTLFEAQTPQPTWVYHASAAEHFNTIRKHGLLPQGVEDKVNHLDLDELDNSAYDSINGQELWFSRNEDDVINYADGLILRFPMPKDARQRIGKRDYWTTKTPVPPEQIQYKTELYDDWKPLKGRLRKPRA
jgi:hypothetical protein